MAEIILLILFIIILFHYLFFLYAIYSGLTKLKHRQTNAYPEEFVSVIVPFRNESKNILNVYTSLTNQNYPINKYEIIFVNDHSDDNSLELLQNINKSENVFIYSVPMEYNVKAHKKRAVRFGIEKSRGDIIVTTDADCYHNKEWLINLLKYFDKNTGFISGPVQFIGGNNLFLKMQQLEFAGLVITGAGLIGAGSPTICNAANIAYRKDAYNFVGGYSSQMNLSSGDDELLMQKIHNETDYKVVFALDKNAIVSTFPNKSVKEFYDQRKRWASKGLFYRDKFLVLKLVLIFLFYVLLVTLPILGILLNKIYFFVFLIFFTIKIFSEYLVLRKGSILLFNLEILRPFLITEIIQIPYILISGFMGSFGNYKWKNRKVKR